MVTCCAQPPVYEDRVTEALSGTRKITIVDVSDATLSYAAAIVSAEAVAVEVCSGRVAQPELMKLPTVEFKGLRSNGLPKGKMIVMRKNA